MCREPESNWRHQVFQTCALPTELSRHVLFHRFFRSLPMSRATDAFLCRGQPVYEADAWGSPAVLDALQISIETEHPIAACVGGREDLRYSR
jgi:hypothetical protein